ncbi:hypothetical protein JKF63_01103 [Porcisia hertigi]|uniref:Uncharacterized protein n=1 Tax=Porcisia hertigi TaxID=2761500 RepID=A0A836HXG0_9TRYP|nr:hypothetical protein JKF63_01103 [Porcisia hertigi]
MHPIPSISMKPQAVDAEPRHDKVDALSSHETESMELTIATTATTKSQRCRTSIRRGKDQSSSATMHEASTTASSAGSLSLLPMMTATTSPSCISATTSATGARKRARESAERSSGSHSQCGRSPLRLSAAGLLRCNTATPEQDEEETDFVVTTTRASPAHLQHTPTSQLLSQQQAAPYSVLPDDREDVPRELPVEQMLFTPATVARRPKPPIVLGETLQTSAPSTTSARDVTSPAVSSASRPSSHDEAVQAILRAGPPTTTRLVQLKPGYKVPSPQTPLWAALEDDGDENESAARGSGSTLGETLLNNTTQVTLFQLGEEEEANRTDAMATTTLATADMHKPVTTHECRRLGTRAAGSGSISLPAPGRSLNLLDEDGLDDEHLPLFVGTEGHGWDDKTDSESVSLTQEANQQERSQDMRAVLPRSRRGRGTTSSAAARASTSALSHTGKLGSANMSTPSPAPQRAVRTFVRTAQPHASPYSQLRRDVEGTVGEAPATATSESRTTVPAAAVNPNVVLSRKELRWKTDMLKWVERTRAFFHFIDTRPLHVTSSPLKLAAAASSRTQRKSRSQSVVTGVHRASIMALPREKKSRAATSMSLVNRSSSASTVPAAPSPSVAAYRSSHNAFEAVISRVKREAAAMVTKTRSTSAK